MMLLSDIGLLLSLRFLLLLFVFPIRMLLPAMLHSYNFLCLVQRNTVAYEEGQPRQLEDALLLRDAISDLPPVVIIFDVTIVATS